jgi:hypothetical protein
VTRPTRDGGREGGFVIVWMALMLVVLMGMAAFSIDVGHWYLVASREQKAADAAALAAAIHWPGDPAAALAEAQASALRNGFDPSEVTLEAGDGPARVKVTIGRTVDNYFGNFLGMQRTSVSRSAVGEFQASIPLGSPANSFGNEAIGNGQDRWSNLYHSATDQPEFWATINGPRTQKEQGDAHQAKVCTADTMLCTNPDVNPDYIPDGYVYVVRVGAPPPGATSLAIEAFDPAFVNVGNLCTNNFTNNPQQFDTSGSSPNRFDSGLTQYCTGDQLFTGGGQDGIPTTTTFITRAADLSPWNYLDNPVINSAGCDGADQFPGYDGSLGTILSTNTPVSGSYLDNPVTGVQATPRDFIRQWFRLCTLSTGSIPATGGDMVVQIRTNAPLGSPLAATLNQGSGSNHFSLRAAWLKNNGQPANNGGVSVFATDTMSLYANASGADTRFYLTRIFPGAAGRILKLSFFDTGDASDPGDLTVLPPPDSGLSGFANCTYTRPGSGAVDQPAPTCSINGLIRTIDNGDYLGMDIPIPADYTCNTADPEGCWIKLRFDYPSSTSVHDVTTWSAQLVGDPVRLVK